MFYKLDQTSLLWKKDWKKLINTFIVVILVVISSFLMGIYVESKKVDDILLLTQIPYSLPLEPHTKYLDSTFKDYKIKAKIYLSQEKFKGSPIKAYMLADCAKDAYLLTGVFLPVELALAQALLESSMGTKGRSPINNPFNIGEWDEKTVLTFNTTYEGVKAYYKYMTSNYLKCKPIDLLFKNFTNCHGYGYAGHDYGEKIAKLYFSIEKYINKNK
jgi:hypothetical protein